MTIEGVFSACNLLAMVGWMLLLTVPRRRTAMAIAGTAIPLTLAAIYLVLIVSHVRESSGGFSSLDAVAQLFANHWLLLAGWVHYLAFDLFIGAWETRDAMARRVPRLLLGPSMNVMTRQGARSRRGTPASAEGSRIESRRPAGRGSRRRRRPGQRRSTG